MTPYDGFEWVFPTWGAVGVWFFWLIGFFVYSFVANGQTRANKLGNARKVGLVILALVLAVETSQLIHGDTDRLWHSPSTGLLVWLLFEVGDWLAYALHMWKKFPGGLQGWFWKRMDGFFMFHADHAQRKFRESLDPAEVHILNQNRTPFPDAWFHEMTYTAQTELLPTNDEPSPGKNSRPRSRPRKVKS